MIRFIVRLIGILFLSMALILLVLDGSKTIAASELVLTSMGETWFNLDIGSLNLSQALIQRYVHPFLWDPVILWILGVPGWVVLGLPGLLLTFLARPKTKQNFDNLNDL